MLRNGKHSEQCTKLGSRIKTPTHFKRRWRTNGCDVTSDKITICFCGLKQLDSTISKISVILTLVCMIETNHWDKPGYKYNLLWNVDTYYYWREGLVPLRVYGGYSLGLRHNQMMSKNWIMLGNKPHLSFICLESEGCIDPSRYPPILCMRCSSNPINTVCTSTEHCSQK